jgi:hypothetical protein
MMMSEYYTNKLSRPQVILQQQEQELKENHKITKDFLKRHCCIASFDSGIMRCPFCLSNISKSGNCHCPDKT